MSLHAPPSHCRSCPCPEWEADADADAPDGQGPSTSLAAKCDTCEHPLGVHLAKFAFAADEVRARKARGEESVEHCKMLLPDGEAGECPCAVFEAGVGGECGVCGHKKGWHKAKFVVSDHSWIDVGARR